MIRRVVVLAGLALLAAACGDDQPAAAPVFGEVEGGCGVTVLTNDIDDDVLLREGVDCLLSAVDAGSPVVWDLLVPTVEGDPTLYRFTGNGETIIITEDHTRDEFGASSRSALVQECETVDDTGFVPAGVDCVGSSGSPFTLPTEIWPP